MSDPKIVLRRAVPDDFDALIARDEQAFSERFDDDDRERTRASFDFDRFVVALDGDALIGLAGSFDFEMTLPGGAVVPVGGTTWVSVAPTHRRRGLLRRLLDWVHDDMNRRDLAAACLIASESSIYERFGYGAATRQRSVRIDTRSTSIHPHVLDEVAGTTRFADPTSSIEAMHEQYDRARRLQPGELSRSRQWMEDRLAGVKHSWVAFHDDGFVWWKVDADWGLGEAQHTLHVLELVASTPSAHRALWSLVMSVDLVATVSSNRQLSLDDPLPALLTNPRAVRTVALNDFLWVLPLRPAELLATRRYRVADDIVVDVSDGESERLRISGGPEDASCSATDAEPHLTLRRAALGALLLGGASVSELAATGRLTVSEGVAPGRLDAFFGWAPTAHCSTEF